MTTYTTRDEAITREIIEPLGEWAAQHDIDAIAETYLTTTGEGTTYAWTAREELDFWAVAEANAR